MLLLDEAPEIFDVSPEVAAEAFPSPRELVVEECPVAARGAVVVSESIEPPFRGFDVRYAAATTATTIRATRAAVALSLKLDVP